MDQLYRACMASKSLDECAQSISSHYETIRSLLKSLVKSGWSEYAVDYDLKVTEKDIKSEKDKPVQMTLYLKAIHDRLYDWLVKGALYDLDGEKEMQVLPKPIMYYVHICSPEELNVRFHALLLVYALEALLGKHYYVSIDFEQSTIYNSEKEIRLTQLCFEHPKDNRSFVMLIDPKTLDDVITVDYKELLFCNKHITKIVHGSDSQDIPYIYNKLLDDTDKIIEFTQSMIDTRFICEYYRLNVGEIPSNRCKIYDEDSDKSGVFILGVVSEEQQAKLANVLASMGHHLDITWDIRKMSRAQTMYAVYDVLYLKYFYYHIMQMATQHLNPKASIQELEDSPETKKVLDLYKYGINQLVGFSYLENNERTILYKTCKEQMDPINNYIAFTSSKPITMIGMYNWIISEDITVPQMGVSLNALMKVNHVKRYILIVIKRLVYGSMTRHCKISKGKGVPFHDKWSNNIIFDYFDKLDYKYLSQMFKSIEQTIDNKVMLKCGH